MEIIIRGTQGDENFILAVKMHQLLKQNQKTFSVLGDSEQLFSWADRLSKESLKKRFISSISMPKNIAKEGGFSSNIASTVIFKNSSARLISLVRGITKGLDIDVIYCILK